MKSIPGMRKCHGKDCPNGGVTSILSDDTTLIGKRAYCSSCFQLVIKPDPRNRATHSVAKVTVNGRVYACTWAGTPTREMVLQSWCEDRRAFRPYDETEGRYVK